MTREVDGTQYYGFWVRNFSVFAGQYPLLTLDPKTDQAIVTDDNWVQLMQFLKTLYQIPGRTPAIGDNQFLKDKTLAMWPIGAENTNRKLKDNAAPDLNWDMVNMPTRPDQPGQSTYANGIVFGISSTSEHKDQAFKVIAYLGSDEVQDTLSADGMPPAITNPAVLNDYGKNNPT